MPDAVVVRCSAPNCNYYQAVLQALPAKDEYFLCKRCSSKDGGQTRQPCRIATRPDGQLLRSYDVDEMRRWAKKLNEAAEGCKNDGMISWQKNRCAAPAAATTAPCRLTAANGTARAQDPPHAGGTEPET